jgi:hypothetical protein
MDFLIAGASFPCGAAALGAVASRHGFRPTFIDHPHNAASTGAGLSPLRIEVSLPEDLARGGGPFLPLLESWVSEGRKLPESGGLRFDRRAATISRSKLALSAALAEAGVSHVPRYRVGTIAEALAAASQCGYPAVLRTDAGYSGRGVWVAHSAADLRAWWARQSDERAGPGFAEMRSVVGAGADALIVEPWLAGNEWSIDCVVGPAGAYLIRACEKATAVVAGRPVTLGYRLTDTVDLWAELRQAVGRWSRVLFRAGAVSFACFDVRRHPNRRLVPLDFGARLGGDSIPLLIRAAGQGGNAYAAALGAALAGDPRRMAGLRAGPALVHAFARQPGTFAGLTIRGGGEVVNSRPHGFVIEPQEGLPVCRRVGTVLTCFRTRGEFGHACRTSSEWIQVSVR